MFSYGILCVQIFVKLYYIILFLQVKRVNVKVTDLLRPAVPLLKTNVAEISDDLASVGGISQQLSDIDLLAYAWDFDLTDLDIADL